MSGEAAQQLVAIVSSLNPLATVIPCEQSRVRGSGGYASSHG
jgi:hypothetical protein